MLYGAEGRSGHRHLDGDRAFRRNSLDVFQIATPHSLGPVCKIRVWHDNKGLWGRLRPPGLHPRRGLTQPLPAGLSPAWFLQHVIVRDLQTARSTFFLVNEWLSVETEANGGLVEKEVPAASKGPSLPLWPEGCPSPPASAAEALPPSPQVRRPCGSPGASWWPSCSAASSTSTSGCPSGTGRRAAASRASSGPPAASFSSASSWVPMLCGTRSWETLPTGGCCVVGTRVTPPASPLRPFQPVPAAVSLLSCPQRRARVHSDPAER